MQCEACGKKEATVHITEIVNDKVTKIHLCEGCAKEKGAEMEEHFGLSDLLSGLADLGTGLEAQNVASAKCPLCGYTYQDFKKAGRFGCSECYETFKKNIDPLLKRIHGSNRHIGKVSLMVGKTAKSVRMIQNLKTQLEKAIQSENFEEAARIRDKIKDLDKKAKEEKSQS